MQQYVLLYPLIDCHKLAEGPNVTLDVLIGFFLSLPTGLAFPLSGIFFCCPAKDVWAVCAFGGVLLLITMVECEVEAGVSVVVATTACKSLVSPSIGSF